MKKNKKRDRVFLLLLILLGVSIGFAALTTTLKINGNTTINKNTWNIYWDNIDNKIGVTPTSIDIEDESETNKDNIVTFSITLDKPGDFFEFTVDAVNAGTIDAEVLSIEKKFDNTLVPTVEDPEDRVVPAYLKYEVTYEDGSEIGVGDKLVKAPDLTSTPKVLTRKTVKVRVEYDRDAVTNTDVNTQTAAVSHTFSFNIQFGQATPSEDDPIAQRIAEIEADPDEYRNPEQDVSNRDIAIDINGNVIDLDDWIGTETLYYEYTDKSYSMGYGESNEKYGIIGNCGGYLSMATASENIVNGDWVAPIPAYILFEGESEFVPVKEVDCLFARRDYDSQQRTPITKYPNFPQTITYIGPGAFDVSEIFESLTIPKQIERIDSVAFAGAFKQDGLNNTLTFENGSQLKYIGEHSFIGNNLVGNLVLPSTVENIDNEAFTYNNLTSVSLPTTAQYYDNYYDAQNQRYCNSFDDGVTITRR